MAEELKGISVVMAGEDEAALVRTIEALHGQFCPPAEIVIVGPSALQKRLRQMADVVRLVATSAPHPHTRLLNMGLRAARGTVVVILDAGIEPGDEHWLRRLTEPFTESDVAATCSAFRLRAGGEVLGVSSLPLLAAGPSSRRAAAGAAREVEFITGHCDAFSTAVLKDVAWLDDTHYPRTGWDRDLSARLRAKDYKILQTDCRADLHAGAASPGKLWRSAVERGRVSACLQRMHHVVADHSVLFLLCLFALLLAGASTVSLGYAMIGVCVLFILSWLNYVKAPLIPLHLPLGLFHFTLFTTAILLTRHGACLEVWTHRNWPDMHPAFFRQYLFVVSAAGFYTFVTGLAALGLTARAARVGIRLVRLPLVFLIALLWYPLSGIGYLKGTLQNVGK